MNDYDRAKEATFEQHCNIKLPKLSGKLEVFRKKSYISFYFNIIKCYEYRHKHLSKFAFRRWPSPSSIIFNTKKIHF